MPASPSDQTLSDKRYRALLRDVEKTLRTAEDSANDETIEAYWQIGARISKERISANAGYHNSVLRDLAADTQLAVRSLQRAVQFHELYPKPPVSDGLSWSHFRVLLQLKDPAERRFYTKLASSEKLTVRQLASAVASNRFAGDGQTEEGTPSIARPNAPDYLYAATVHNIVDADTLDLDIDLGFNTYRRQRVRLACLDAPEVGAPHARQAKNFVAKQLLAARTIVVQSLNSDIHGRCIVHLFLSRRKTTISECFRSGTHLNDQMLRHRAAQPVL